MGRFVNMSYMCKSGKLVMPHSHSFSSCIYLYIAHAIHALNNLSVRTEFNDVNQNRIELARGEHAVHIHCWP